METRDQGNGIPRRSFLKTVVALGTVAVPGMVVAARALLGQADESPAAISKGAPPNVSWQANISPAGEPGEALIVTGTLFAADGRTPLKDGVLYLYHTDATGVYNKTDGLWWKPRLRGWMKAGADGRYEFRSIRPASYPNSRNPQHIHAIVYAPGVPAQWMNDFLFDDDPLLRASDRDASARDGRFGHVLKLTRGGDGVWRGTRDIRVK